jgi:hypothetical protein
MISFWEYRDLERHSFGLKRLVTMDSRTVQSEFINSLQLAPVSRDETRGEPQSHETQDVLFRLASFPKSRHDIC